MQLSNRFKFHVRRTRMRIINWLKKNDMVWLPRNEKQRALLQGMKMLKKASGIVALETGRIRNAEWKDSDGESTEFLTGRREIARLISVDNDSENFTGLSGSEIYCRSYLKPSQLAKLDFLNNDSRKAIACLPSDTIIDLVLLDSANDPDLIYEEFLAVQSFLNRDNAVIIVDDVNSPGVKGDRLLPFLKRHGYKPIYVKAHPSDCAIIQLHGFLPIEV